MCRGDYRYCYLCYGTYGVNITSRRCIPCIDPNCISCTYDAAICTNCTAGYGVTTVATCALCNSSSNACLGCISSNILKCTSCPITRYLSGTICDICISFCDICTNNSICITCSPGYYR